ncbi:MAG: insulinase family protein [Cyclobacteriaceae bacterium]|nr:insulinase family protein [Cyclobacteriaceae bacterium]
MKDYDIYTLSNGIRVIHKQVTHTKIIHCGFILDVGSRDENIHNQGIAHFWEHMAFKGTSKRKAYHIMNLLESHGGELNAYTTKEKITFYASVLQNHFEKAFDLLSDITFDSIFPEKQIANERQVILEEMAMYKDSPDDDLQDEFDDLVFRNHPLGMNILGVKSTVDKFKKDDFTTFINQNIDTERIVFSCVGNMSFQTVKKLADKYIGHIPKISSSRKRISFNSYIPQSKVVEKNVLQSLCAMGLPTYSNNDERRLPFYMLVNILGGPGMNSRLNMELREKHGLVYTVDANYSSFSDTGLFSIFFGTEPKQMKKSIDVVKKELKKLRLTPLGNKQIHVAKEQLKGQLAMAEENNVGLMLAIGKSLIDRGYIDSLESIFNQIDNVTSKQLQDLANEMFDDKLFSYLTYTPD